MNPQKKLKTYNITYREHEGNPISVKTVTYKANTAQQAEELFYADCPEQRERTYIEIHSPLSNYQVDRDNEIIAESTTTTTTTTTTTALDNSDDTTTTTTTTTTTEEPIDNTTTTSEKIADYPNNDNNTTTNTSTTTNTITMKKLNILNVFKTVNEYVQQITMLFISLIPLFLLGVIIFGDNFFYGNLVVYNIQSILDSMAGFVGIVTLILIVYFYSRTTHSK